MSTVPAAALRLWRRLADDPSALAPGTRRVTRDTNGFCPPGWVGVVRLGDAYALDPGVADADVIGRLLALDDPTDPTQVRTVLAPQQALGPAELAYLPDNWVAPEIRHDGVVLEERDVAGLRDWLRTLPEDDLAESSVIDMSRVVVALVDGDIAGAVGHLAWPEQVAHIGIVVGPDHRRRGVGRALAVAGTVRAQRAGLAPQWRAASDNPASRALAAAVGYAEVGRQFSFAPAD
ncbi:MAG TPA: GNAT family N-acetyltransferase [Egicoccus sp.]|nr:GNAT family N-acetyltransferase [Egicoccus sp.]HSK24869.1 GNAT family N-acetyltransferase [Egicoccus sp.]